MIRSIRRAALAALALPLLALTSVPAHAVASVTRTVSQEAQVDWYATTVNEAAGTFASTSVSVTVYVDAGVTHVTGHVTQGTCAVDYSWCTSVDRYLDGTPTTYTVNKAGTIATLAGNIQSYSDWEHAVSAGSVPISLTWTATAEPAPLFGYKYRGYNLIEKSSGTWHQPATVVGTIGGLTPPADAWVEMSIGSFTMITSTPNRNF
ncbi:MAG: hypothetical protein JWM93_2944 [Frankiales bacterium]|nr:hypothetical protein [Frankiales bacterium]